MIYSSTRSGNLELVTALSKWVLKENGVLRVKKVEHHLAGSREVPREYTIMNEVVSSFMRKFYTGIFCFDEVTRSSVQLLHYLNSFFIYLVFPDLLSVLNSRIHEGLREVKGTF